MWLIRTALRKPYTFVVMAMLIALGGSLSARRMPTDIFPTIDIPVISVIWNYGGLPPIEIDFRAECTARVKPRSSARKGTSGRSPTAARSAAFGR